MTLTEVNKENTGEVATQGLSLAQAAKATPLKECGRRQQSLSNKQRKQGSRSKKTSRRRASNRAQDVTTLTSAGVASIPLPPPLPLPPPPVPLPLDSDADCEHAWDTRPDTADSIPPPLLAANIPVLHQREYGIGYTSPSHASNCREQQSDSEHDRVTLAACSSPARPLFEHHHTESSQHDITSPSIPVWARTLRLPLDLLIDASELDCPALTSTNGGLGPVGDSSTLLGNGAYGSVHCARWHGMEVAVKIVEEAEQEQSHVYVSHPSLIPSPSLAQEFASEARVWSRLHCPNLVNLYGLVLTPRPAMIMAFAQRGALSSYLHAPPPPLPCYDGGDEEGVEVQEKDDSYTEFDLGTLVRLAREVASGVEYMHARGVLHRDLKSFNVLIDTDGHARLGDFGLSIDEEECRKEYEERQRRFQEKQAGIQARSSHPVSSDRAKWLQQHRQREMEALQLATPCVSPNRPRDRPGVGTPAAAAAGGGGAARGPLSPNPFPQPRHSPSKKASVAAARLAQASPAKHQEPAMFKNEATDMPSTESIQTPLRTPVKPKRSVQQHHLSPLPTPQHARFPSSFDHGDAHPYLRADHIGLPGSSNGPLGTYGYMSPELFSHGQYSRASDSYAFGCLVWEMLARRLPWSHPSKVSSMDPLDIARLVFAGYRPPIPQQLPPSLRTLLQWCWQQDPDARPSFKQIREVLERMEEEIRREEEDEDGARDEEQGIDSEDQTRMEENLRTYERDYALYMHRMTQALQHGLDVPVAPPTPPCPTERSSWSYQWMHASRWNMMEVLKEAGESAYDAPPQRLSLSESRSTEEDGDCFDATSPQHTQTNVQPPTSTCAPPPTPADASFADWALRTELNATELAMLTPDKRTLIRQLRAAAIADAVAAIAISHENDQEEEEEHEAHTPSHHAPISQLTYKQSQDVGPSTSSVEAEVQQQNPQFTSPAEHAYVIIPESATTSSHSSATPTTLKAISPSADSASSSSCHSSCASSLMTPPHDKPVSNKLRRSGSSVSDSPKVADASSLNPTHAPDSVSTVVTPPFDPVAESAAVLDSSFLSAEFAASIHAASIPLPPTPLSMLNVDASASTSASPSSLRHNCRSNKVTPVRTVSDLDARRHHEDDHEDEQLASVILPHSSPRSPRIDIPPQPDDAVDESTVKSCCTIM